MIMKALCAGAYPSIEEQARRLQSEPGMPEWSLPTYVKQIEAINMALALILVENFRRKLAK